MGRETGTARQAWHPGQSGAGPRPPFADRVTPGQRQALDVAAAVIVALWMVFDLRLRHGFRVELPPLWLGALGAAATLPVALRRRWPLPVLAVVTTAVAVLTALGRAQFDLDLMLAMAIYTVAVTATDVTTGAHSTANVTINVQ